MNDARKELTDTLNDIFDCIDLVCDKLDVDDETRDKLWNYLTGDILIPSIKDGIMKVMQGALYGSRCYKRDSNGKNRKSTDYSRISSISFTDERFKTKFVFDTQEKATYILSKLLDSIEEYEKATVGYLYELVGESSSYVNEYYGWDDAERFSKYARIIEKPDGKYELRLPAPTRFTTP